MCAWFGMCMCGKGTHGPLFHKVKVRAVPKYEKFSAANFIRVGKNSI